MPRRAPLAPLALALLASLAAPAGAAELSELLALRDAAAPGECAGRDAPRSRPFAGGTLHAMPCRPTAHDALSVLLLERDGSLQPLFFANPDFRFDYAADGTLNWGEAQVGGITVSPVVSQFAADDATGTLTVSSRIAPGLGDGAFVSTHVLEDWGVTLHSAMVSLDSGAEFALWPPAGPGLMQELGGLAALDGFTPHPTPDALLARPAEALALLEVHFPTEEEGRPRMDMALTQSGAQITLTVADHGWADDSVAGRAWRVLMQREGGGWRISGLGSLTICGRGETRLTTGLCP